MVRSNKLMARQHDKKILKQQERKEKVHSISTKVTLSGYGKDYEFTNNNYNKLYDIMLKLKHRKRNNLCKIKVMIELGNTIYNYDKVSSWLANEIMKSLESDRIV